MNKPQALITQDEWNEESDDEISLNDIFHTLWLRKRFLVSVTILITLLASLIIFQLVPRYTATTQMLIGIKSANVINIQEVISQNRDSLHAMTTQIQVIKSRELANQVVDKLRLFHYNPSSIDSEKQSFFSLLNLKNLLPEELKETLGLVKIDSFSEIEKQQRARASFISAFLGKLTVKQIRGSKIVNLSYQSTDPKLATKIVNGIADQYIIGQLQAKFDATEKATHWLNNQLEDLKQTVEFSELAVVQFRKDHNLVEVSKGTGLSQQQLSQINSQLIIARASRAEAQARYNQVASVLKANNNIESLSEALNSVMIQSLRQQESEVQRTYSEMLVEYGKKHPRMIQMRAKLQDFRNKIRSEVKQIAAGLRNDLAVSRSREGSLAYSLKQATTKTGGNNQDEIQLRVLEREAKANRALFETFLSRFKETTSTQSIEQADARVISFAEIPQGASFPKTKLLLIVSGLGALFFAIGLVFILEMLNPGIRSPEQVQDLLKMATLGIVPKTVEKKLTPHQYLLNKPHSSLAEALNTLRVSLSVLNPDSKVKTLLVTSSVPSEGKSTLALLIARQSAKVNQQVVIVDADFRRPSIEKQLGLSTHQKGITDLIAESELKLDDVLIEDTETGMMILARGQASFVNPTDLFASKRMKALIETLKERFDLVILDSPPVMAVPDARVLSALVDKVIFVLAWDETPRNVALSALHQLQKEGHNNLAGIVLQKVNLKQYGRYGYGDSGYYYHYSRYGQYYSG